MARVIAPGERVKLLVKNRAEQERAFKVFERAGVLICAGLPQSEMDRLAGVARFTVGATLLVGSFPYFVFALLIALYATFLPTSGYHPFLDNPLTWASGLTAAWLCLGIANAAAGRGGRNRQSCPRGMAHSHRPQ